MNKTNLICLGLIVIPWACIGKKNSKKTDPVHDNTIETPLEGPSKDPTDTGGNGSTGGGIPGVSLAPAKSIKFADVNGDGMDDAVAFTSEGVFVAKSEGAASFSGSYTRWSMDVNAVDASLYPYEMGDANGDGRADIILFGAKGVFVSLSETESFATPTLWTSSFAKDSEERAFSNQLYYPRFVADINGDKRVDILGCHVNGCYLSLSTGEAFGDVTLAIDDFSTEADGITSNEGWTNMDLYPRFLVDTNGDGTSDLLGCGVRGLWRLYL